MLLVFDIGNSNIVLGTYEGKRLMKHWRISTDRQKTGDEYGMLINDLFRFQGIRMTDIDAIIISSVVPPLVVPLVKMCERYFHLRPLIVGPGIKTGIRLRYENPREIGADRIVNSVGAFEQYGGPLIVVDGNIFEGKLTDIDPATIKKQRVLKDAIATAIYGSQGDNGVIEITTKRE